MPALVVRHLIPQIILEVGRNRFKEEEKGVDIHRLMEDPAKVVHEEGVKPKKRESQQSTQEGGETKGPGQELREFVGKAVISGVLCSPADDFNGDGEDRYAEDKGPEHEVELSDNPDGDTGIGS